MNYKLVLGVLLVCFACSTEEGILSDENNIPSTSKNKILPLGASRVEGARPDFESYRYELWKLLVDSNVEFDFIGTRQDDANYPDYNNMTFDSDHEGRGGLTSGEILSGIEAWLLQTGAPDIVLFSSPGGNDALNGASYERAIANINAVIDALQSSNANVTIIIEQLAPARSDTMTDELTQFFNQMQQDVVAIANTQRTANSRVLVVDMASGFTDTFLADDVHYNEAGARFVAGRYFEVLEDILTD